MGVLIGGGWGVVVMSGNSKADMDIIFSVMENISLL